MTANTIAQNLFMQVGKEGNRHIIVDVIIDGGYGNNEATTVIDCTGDEPVIIREGIGIPE